MSLVQIFSVPGKDISIQEWSFAHAVNHRDIIGRIFTTYGTLISEPILDPFDPTTTWFYQHQALHQAMDQVLGIQSQDLLSVDWQDEDSVLDWIQAHFVEHQLASAKFGLG